MSDRDYYCSMKFRFLKVDLESLTTYNCHAAAPHRVDFDWLGNNPGQLFNNPVSIRERQQMLANERNKSCEQNCWRSEDVGAVSPRLYQGGMARTCTQVSTKPEIIDLTIGGDCNLTCSYCCKEYSSAWRRDLLDNGEYPVADPRFKIETKHKALVKISQGNLKSSARYKLLLSEIKNSASDLKRLIITGGEPFLDNSLVDIILGLEVNPDTHIDIYTGLGVNYNRLERLLTRLVEIKNVSLIVSAESTGQFSEFNRYGIKWTEFVDKINLIKQKEINYIFASTISNLTVFDFANFYKQFSDTNIELTFAYTPAIMAPHVLDADSKMLIRDCIIDLPDNYRQAILKSIQADPTEEDRINLRKFLIEFTKRRPNISMDIYPTTFLDWLELNVV